MIYNRRIGCVCSVWLLAACSAPSEGSDDPGQDVGPGGAGNSALPPATTAGGGTSNGGGTGLIDETPGVEGNVPPVGGVTASGNVPCDVATIVRDHCSTCHGSEPKFNAPMSLTSATDFAATAPISGTDPVRAVASRRINATGAARMPPPGTVEALSNDELATLTEWLDGGASALAEGGCSILDTASTPGASEDLLPRPSTTGTTLGPFVGWDDGGVECYPLTAFQPGDKSTPYQVGTAVDKYMGFGFKPPWEGARFVRAFKTVVDNEQVLHHWILFEEPTAADGSAVEIIGAHPGGAMMHGWAPGGSDLYFTPDLGMRMDGNSSYLLEVHYNSNDPNAVDASGVEVCVSAQQPENEAIISWLGTDAINGTQAEGTCAPRATEPIHIVAGTPHMHLKGTHMKVTLTRAAGGTEIVHDEPFAFENQRGYQQNVTLQPGDRLTTACSYNAPTTFGRGTNEEMCYWFALAYPAGALTDNGFIGSGGPEIVTLTKCTPKAPLG